MTQAVVSGAGRSRVSLRRLTLKALLWGLGAMAAAWVVSPLVDGFLNLKSPGADLAIGVWIPLAVVAAAASVLAAKGADVHPVVNGGIPNWLQAVQAS